MPIKLIPPRQDFSPYYYMRGTHLGIFVDESTRALRPAIAKRVIEAKEREIERRRLEPAPVAPRATFLKAAHDYMAAGGDARPVARLISHFGEAPLRPPLPPDTTLQQYWQGQMDAAALALFPTHSAATRNREVYTPVSAILKSAGIEFKIRRPKGSRGRELTGWLWPEQAEALLIAAFRIDVEFGLLCTFLLYTGVRLSEAIKWLRCDDLRLDEAFAFIPHSKNGKPVPVHLPPILVAALANHPRGLDRGKERVFRWHKSGRLYKLIYRAAADAGISLPEREAFHVFRHSHATWRVRYGGNSVESLPDTGLWRSRQSARRYAHTVVGEEARKADMLPTITIGKLR
jgi:integrase